MDQQYVEIENRLQARLPEACREFIELHGGKFFGDSIRFYAADEIVERNECYETRVYCNGFITIGDDGGGRAIMTDPQSRYLPVFVVGHGSMSVEHFERVSDRLMDWIARGCPLE